MIAPLPPVELIERVGAIEDPVGNYLAIGEHQRRILAHYEPAGWSWAGKTLLDWGCGAGRLLRLLADTPDLRLIGVEIDAPSVDWMRTHLPSVEGIVVDRPVLPLADASVDVVTGFSVMTHIDDDWAAWLLEIRRVLRPGGFALLSLIGSLTGPLLLERPWVEDDIGMLVLRYANPWTRGGPDVVHSEWWVREHWGRAFDVLSIESDPLEPSRRGQHHMVMLGRPASPAPTVDELEAISLSEPREVAGLRSSLAWSRGEIAAVREELAAETAQHHAVATELHDTKIGRDALAAALADEEERRAELADELAAFRSTISWRVTTPLRVVRRKLP